MDVEASSSSSPVVCAAGNERAPLQKQEEASSSNQSQTYQSFAWRAIGPGMLVCLADTDAGCLIVAAQSGARWGYSLLLLQLVLIPILFMTQELTVRLGVYSKKGQTACIREHYGPFWAWFACILLVVECTLAMTSELSGVAAVGEIWGLSRNAAILIAALVVICVVLLGNYRQIEAIGVTLGLFELTFVVTMFCFHPSPRDVLKGSFTFYSDSEYIKLIAANLGAVIMPWMIYFQQSAVVARRLVSRQDFIEERTQTLFGSVLTQLVMIGTLVTLAAAHGKSANLGTVKDITDALAPVLGEVGSKLLVSFGFVGGSLCAAFVVSLAAAWSVCEAMDIDTAFSLDETPTQAPQFYGCFLLVIIIGTAVLFSGISYVKLSVFIESLDGFLVPFAVGFLFLLCTGEALPPEARVVGMHKYVLAVVFGLCTILALATGVYGYLG
mmetsp:Transcript_105871/g.330118  ORF Transcript_105871/g.330118 Transcript_105871/m.330118 type:complete len:441 (+) Transcript_105871:98-1420(+)